jgi:phospholipid transport system substrate-binding protein
MRAFMAVLTLAASLCLPVPGWAAPVQAPPELIKATGDKTLEALKRDRALLQSDPRRAYKIVEDIILPHFDFQGMAQTVLAAHWRSASEEQRKRFTDGFRDLLVRTYATALSEYSDETFEILPVREQPSDTEAVVRTHIVQKGGSPVPVIYTLNSSGTAWKVVDVNIAGMSLVSNYRLNFASEIRRKGLDALIATLASRSAAAVKPAAP